MAESKVDLLVFLLVVQKVDLLVVVMVVLLDMMKVV